MSRICAEIDADVEAFRNRPLDEKSHLYVWLDATHLKAREDHRIVPLRRWWLAPGRDRSFESLAKARIPVNEEPDPGDEEVVTQEVTRKRTSQMLSRHHSYISCRNRTGGSTPNCTAYEPSSELRSHDYGNYGRKCREGTPPHGRRNWDERGNEAHDCLNRAYEWTKSRMRSSSDEECSGLGD